MKKSFRTGLAALGGFLALSASFWALAAQDATPPEHGLASNASELAAAADAARRERPCESGKAATSDRSCANGAQSAGSTTLGGIRLGSLLSEYPECAPNMAAICWTKTKIDGMDEFFGFHNIRQEAPGALGQKQQPEALVELTDGRIEKIGLRFHAQAASESRAMRKEVGELASAKWDGWKGPAADNGQRVIWRGPNGIIGAVWEFRAEPSSALIELSTQDFERLRASEKP